MADGQPEPGDEEPDDVADPAHGAGPGGRNHLTPEGPQDVGGDTEGGDARGDRDDEQAGDQSEEEVAEEEPEPAEDDPDDVEQRAHGTYLPHPSTSRAPRPRGHQKMR